MLVILIFGLEAGWSIGPEAAGCSDMDEADLSFSQEDVGDCG